MRKFLQRIWKDFRQGENIDLYATVFVALALVVLNLIGIAPQSWIGPVTLAVLGLLAISSLGSRYRMDTLLEKISQTTEGLFLEEYPPSVRSDLESSSEVWLVGVSLIRTVRTYYSVIEMKLDKGHSIKVLLVDPDSPAVEISEARGYGRPDVGRTRQEIRATLADLCQLRTQTSGHLEIRTTQDPLTYGTYLINPDSMMGVLYLEHYPYKTQGGSRPKLVLRAKDGRWFEFFKEETRKRWEHAKEWQCDGSTRV